MTKTSEVMKHLFEIQQFDTDGIDRLFSEADRILETNADYLKGKVMASIFYEPSTRTRLSFESAMWRLGGSVVSAENATDFSSSAKGETLEDTIRTIESYADLIVLRYQEDHVKERLYDLIETPIINAGDGAGQHPTQALLDLYTIKRELGRVDGITVAVVGDPKHSRSSRSLAYLLGKYRDVTVHFVSPPALAVEGDIKAYLKRHNVTYNEYTDIQDVIAQSDIIYCNRIQRERFDDSAEYEKYKDSFCITKDIVGEMKQGAILMDPLPRVGGIDPEVDALPQAMYFKQPYYGLLIRMALLKMFLRGR